jgi:peptidyl-tRNA hydrolase
VPWAMQLAIRYDKGDPAGHVETCEAAARAVVGLLAAPEANGEWAERIYHWRDGRIRKLVRRARGIRWIEVQALPGVTVEQGKAAVRAFVPGPVRPLPPELAKLQVSGTELPNDRPSTNTDVQVLIGISPHLAMSTGKAAAQCGHAAQLAWEAMTPADRERWTADGHRVRVGVVEPALWRSNPGRIRVVDAGFTELDGPTETTRAWWR